MKRFMALMAVLGVLAAAGAKGKATKTKAEDFVHVDCGMFLMGSGEFGDTTKHVAVVSEFFICNHEVTQEEYQSVMGKNPSKFKGKNRPVENVSWYDAVEYCNRLSIAEGLTPCYSEDFEMDIGADGYRLPTETEWEFAARGGELSEGFLYHSGSLYIDDVAWWSESSGGKTHDVMKKLCNELDIYDMNGNVEEWCWDWYEPYPDEDTELDPTGPADGYLRIVRGGAYNTEDLMNCTIFVRGGYEPELKQSNIGFRVVRSGPRG